MWVCIYDKFWASGDRIYDNFRVSGYHLYNKFQNAVFLVQIHFYFSRFYIISQSLNI